MLQYIVSNKVQKSKQNIDTYLSNSSGSNQAQQPKQQPAPVPAASSSTAARPNQQQSTSTFHLQNNATASTNKNNKQLAKNQIQLKIIAFSGKQFTREGMLLRFSKQEGKFQFIFEEDGVKAKLEVKRQALMSKRIKVNFAQGTCVFQIKLGIIKKQDTKESSIKGGQAVWTFGKQLNQTPVTVWLKDKQQLKAFAQCSFMEGLVDFTTVSSQPMKTQNPPAQQLVQVQQDHNNIKLSMPTSAQQTESEKIRKIIKQMKDEDKVTVLMQVFKIKKQYQDPTSIIRKLKCPIYYCEKKSYKDVQQLRNHLKTKHPQLSKHGIQLSQYDGTLQYGSKAMDLALFIGKLFPLEMKKIIRQMKTKPVE